MKTNQQKHECERFLTSALLVLSVITLAGSGSALLRDKKSAKAVVANPSNRKFYVHRGAVWPQLRSNLRTLGDRLENPGKEQMIMTGTLTRAGANGPAAAILTVEVATRMQLTTQTGIQSKLITFDGTDTTWSALAPSDRDLVETLFFDTSENFFFDHARGAVTRGLGLRFQLDDQPAGSRYDIYWLRPLTSFTSVRGQGAKLFHFNSENRLLELVRYQSERNGMNVSVEVRLSNWSYTNGQAVPRRVDRLENGTNVMTLTINTVSFGPSASR